MSFLTRSLIAGLFLVNIACFVRAGSAESAAVPLEKTMGKTPRDQNIYLCCCYTVEDVAGHLPCDEMLNNHLQDKVKENYQIVVKHGMPDSWVTVDKLSRLVSQCSLYEAVAVPVFDCYTAQITNANGTLPVEKMRLNWLYNKASENDKILEKYGVLVEGDNQQKAALEVGFVKCLQNKISEAFSSN